MRVFKSKTFSRWAAKENLDDAKLAAAARDIVAGVGATPLGQGLFKMRIARPGGGKRGGYRVLLGYLAPNQERIIFIHGFAKNVRADISPRERLVLHAVLAEYLKASDQVIAVMLTAGTLAEITEV